MSIIDDLDLFYNEEPQPPVMYEIRDCEVVTRTKKAALVRKCGEQVWLPLSQIEIDGSVVRYPEWMELDWQPYKNLSTFGPRRR